MEIDDYPELPCESASADAAKRATERAALDAVLDLCRRITDQAEVLRDCTELYLPTEEIEKPCTSILTGAGLIATAARRALARISN